MAFLGSLDSEASLLPFAPYHALAFSQYLPCSAFALIPVFPFPALPIFLRPHSSVPTRYCNYHQFSIDSGIRPRLRPRLTQSRSALLWKPWIFGLKDSHFHLATHSGILSCASSTVPSDPASSSAQCSSTNAIACTPQLRCHVLAPDIFGAKSLD